MERLGLILNDGSDNPPHQVLIRLTGQHGHGDAHQSANHENDSNLTGVDSKTKPLEAPILARESNSL